ncbi:MAG: hypothetical protein U0930_22820, partial [Pirellulales bacterium]
VTQPAIVSQPAVVSPGYSTNYGPTTTYSPVTSYPGSTYPSGTFVNPNYSSTGVSSVPFGSSTFGTPSVGSAGAYSQPVPGLMAPPSGSSVYSGSGSSVLPGTSSSTTGSVYPQQSGSFIDPANTPPSLPADGNSVLRPQLKSIVPEATRSGRESALNSSSSGERSLLSEPAKEFPINNPIPAPEGMEKPSWSPGLLRNEDMTALRPVTRSTQLAGQSKKIHWASFEQELSLTDSNGNSVNGSSASSNAAQPNRPKPLDQSVPALRPQATRPSHNDSLQLTQPSAPRSDLRPNDMVPLSSQQSSARTNESPARAKFNPSSSPVQTPTTRGPTSSGSYNTSGWTSTRN